MGIKISGDANPDDEIHLQELEIGDNHNNILALAKIEFSDVAI
jgi:hypothetical protein